MSYVPSTAQGKKAVARLGRTKATGGFARIEKKAEAEGKSASSAAKIAGSVYWKMARGR